MNTPEEKKVVVTAVISAIVEGLRRFPNGVPDYLLYSTIAKLMDRPAFDMIVEELVAQRTVRKTEGRLWYCGPGA